MKNSIQFPEAKKIDYTKFIEPKKQIFATTVSLYGHWLYFFSHRFLLH
jgi:hypothetical protein